MIELFEQGVPVAWEWTDQLVLLDRWAILREPRNRRKAIGSSLRLHPNPKCKPILRISQIMDLPTKRHMTSIKREKAVLLPTYPEKLRQGSDHEMVNGTGSMRKKWNEGGGLEDAVRSRVSFRELFREFEH